MTSALLWILDPVRNDEREQANVSSPPRSRQISLLDDHKKGRGSCLPRPIYRLAIDQKATDSVPLTVRGAPI
ncbi:hypothetical protein [Sphingopyxis indica]|uniref:hypothetical protein n=1 Tax=Sphingopyxis indica TaxID=436663 RepID=UPI0014835921|nr:hypothetical protein [Sphingopyxis indica]